ncbi:MAG: hypothetical protein NTX01_04885 [Candidatus Omnitrophica bacterium]|nr:hypothetical protein [Candidatus Omnitrophota bacterium]
MGKIFKIIFLLVLIFNLKATVSAKDINEKTYIFSDEINIKVSDNKNLLNGIKLLKAKKYLFSVSSFEKFILEDDNSLDTIGGISIVSFGTIAVDLDQGVKYFESELQKNPDNLYLYYALGIFNLLQFNQDGLASENINKYLKNNSYQVHYILGLAYGLENKKELYSKECEYLKKNGFYNLSERLDKAVTSSNAKKYIDKVRSIIDKKNKIL